MRIIVHCIILFAATLPTSVAQNRPTQPIAWPPSEGTARLFITPAPSEIATSLRDLGNLSSLVVEGTVKITLPPREPSPRTLETDAVILVNRTLKGPGTAREIVISQRGGVIGAFSIKPVHYSLVQRGEQYIFFLRDDKRESLSAAPGLQRYLIAGIWSGLFRFAEGKMRVGAEAPEDFRRRYEGMTLDQMAAEITAAVKP